jgi:hypothetical protein
MSNVSQPTFSPAQDGVYVYVQPPTPIPFASVSTSLGGKVGVGSWGKTNTPLYYGPAESTLFNAVGRLTSHPNAIVTEALNFLDQGSSGVVCRVTDGTDTAGQIAIVDSTSGATIALLTGLCTGSRINTAAIFLAVSALSTTAKPSWRLTTQMPDGNPEVFDNLPAYTSTNLAAPAAPTTSTAAGGTLAGKTYYVKITYTNALGETVGSTEISQAVAVNNLLVIDSPAAQAGATGWNAYVSTLTGQEVRQNASPIAIGTNWTLPTTGLVAGAVVPSVTTAQVVTLSTVALGAAISNALNNGTAGRAPSAYFSGTAGSSTGAVAAGTFTVSSTGGVVGTDGIVTITTAILLGSDGAAGQRTGLFALRGTGVDGVILCGCYDPSAATTVSSFVNSEYAYGLLLCGPSGTNTAEALTAQQNNNMKQTVLVTAIDWVGVTDINTGAARLVSPLGHILGEISSIPPEQNPGNKPAPSGFETVLYTESSIGQNLGGTDLGNRTQAGLVCITNVLSGASGQFRLSSGQNASSNGGSTAATDGINYVRMTNYLVKALFALLAPFVDTLQSFSADDDDANKMADTLIGFLQTLQSQGRIQAFTVDAITGNTQNTVAAGYRYISINVTYMGTARYIIPTLQGGTTVLISSSNQSAAASTAASYATAA